MFAAIATVFALGFVVGSKPHCCFVQSEGELLIIRACACRSSAWSRVGCVTALSYYWARYSWRPVLPFARRSGACSRWKRSAPLGPLFFPYPRAPLLNKEAVSLEAFFGPIVLVVTGLPLITASVSAIFSRSVAMSQQGLWEVSHRVVGDICVSVHHRRKQGIG